MSNTRFCPKCQAETERYANGRCKPCKRAYDAAWAVANPKKIRAIKAAVRARNPGKHRARSAAWRARNPDRVRANNVAYRAAHPEKCRARASDYRADYPDKYRIYEKNRHARKLASGGVLSHGLAERLFKLQRGKCPCCKQPLGDDFHLDHRMPLALGGSNTDDNMQLLRQRCNNQKHAKDPIDFMQQRGFLI